MIRGRSLFSINLGESLWGETNETFQTLTEEVQQNWSVIFQQKQHQKFTQHLSRLN